MQKKLTSHEERVILNMSLRLGKSQQEIAEFLGVSQSTVSNFLLRQERDYLSREVRRLERRESESRVIPYSREA